MEDPPLETWTIWSTCPPDFPELGSAMATTFDISEYSSWVMRMRTDVAVAALVLYEEILTFEKGRYLKLRGPALFFTTLPYLLNKCLLWMRCAAVLYADFTPFPGHEYVSLDSGAPYYDRLTVPNSTSAAMDKLGFSSWFSESSLTSYGVVVTPAIVIFASSYRNWALVAIVLLMAWLPGVVNVYGYAKTGTATDFGAPALVRSGCDSRTLPTVRDVPTLLLVSSHALLTLAYSAFLFKLWWSARYKSMSGIANRTLFFSGRMDLMTLLAMNTFAIVSSLMGGRYWLIRELNIPLTGILVSRAYLSRIQLASRQSRHAGLSTTHSALREGPKCSQVPNDDRSVPLHQQPARNLVIRENPEHASTLLSISSMLVSGAPCALSVGMRATADSPRHSVRTRASSPPFDQDSRRLDASTEVADCSEITLVLRSQGESTANPHVSTRPAHVSVAETREALPGRRSKGCYRLSDFTMLRTLGTGSFGRVRLARCRRNSRFCAIKVLNKEKIVRMNEEYRTRNEPTMLLEVQHPFIVTLWGTLQDTANLYIIMDFVPGGELFSLLMKSRSFPDSAAKFYAAEVALVLKYLHQKDIIYRDLKPENILINYDGHIKVVDFGLARQCTTTAWTFCGTPNYLAPRGGYGRSADWYTLGVLIFEMLSGKLPFHEPGLSSVDLYAKILQGSLYIAWPVSLDMNAKDLMLKLMERDPSKRLGNLAQGANDVLAHPWFAEVDWKKLVRREIAAPYLPRIANDGDASAFDRYPEDDAVTGYGETTPDPYGHRFPEFEYTSI